MKKKITKFFLGLLLGGLIAGMTAFNFLLIWVATGPRTLDAITPYIEEALAPNDAHFQVKIGKTLLIWDGWKRPLDMRLNEVRVITKEGKTFSSFPQIKIGLDVVSLFRGQILLRSLSVDKPVIRLFQDENHMISFGPQESLIADDPLETAGDAPKETLPLTAILAPLIDATSNSPLRKLRSVKINNATVKVINPGSGIFFEAHAVEFAAKRDGNGVMELRASARARYDEYQSTFSAQCLIDQKQTEYHGVVDFKGVEPQTLLRLFSDSTRLNPLAVSLSGSSQITINKDGSINRLQFNVEGGEGQVDFPQLPDIKNLSWLHAEGQISNGFKDIQIDELRANVAGVLTQADGLIQLAENDMAIRANLEIKDIPTERVAGLWPSHLAPVSREWVTSNITSGKVSVATLKTNINFGDLAKPTLPKTSIDAAIELDKVSIRYLPDHPETKNLSGIIHIDGETLDTDISSADYMSATKISKGRVLIEDLNIDNPYIKVTLNAESPAKDIARFLGLPRLNHAAHLNLKEKDIEGNVKGKASVGFNFFVPHDANGKPTSELPIDYDINAELSDISQTGFLHKFDIKNMSGEISINNASIDYSGKGNVNGASVESTHVKYLFSPEDGFDTFIEAKSNAPIEALIRFGYPPLPFLLGEVSVDLSAKLGPVIQQYKAEIDLLHAAIDHKGMRWKKPIKEAANFSVEAEKKNDLIIISSFDFKGKNAQARGTAVFNKDNELSSLSAKNIVMGETQLDTLSYQKNNDSTSLDIAGDKLDISGYFENSDESEASNFSFEHFPALELKANLSRLQIAGSAEISNVKASLNCSQQRCESADISGNAGKAFSLRISKNPKSIRQFLLRAEDAGQFMKALDIFDGMEGGDLSVTGNYDDTKSSLLSGRVDISSHVIKNAPILGKILSLASLTGFFDTLQGKGIAFDKTRGNFSLQNDVLTLQDIRTHGSAIGMTIEGTVTMPSVALDLQGTIVPSYSLNSALGKVPVVGELLTGGKGQGVFAARYSVKGNEKKPDVSVNPLSILTPGFLRGLFDLGSKEKKELE